MKYHECEQFFEGAEMKWRACVTFGQSWLPGVQLHPPRHKATVTLRPEAGDGPSWHSSSGKRSVGGGSDSWGGSGAFVSAPAFFPSLLASFILGPSSTASHPRPPRRPHLRGRNCRSHQVAVGTGRACAQKAYTCLFEHLLCVGLTV